MIRSSRACRRPSATIHSAATRTTAPSAKLHRPAPSIRRWIRSIDTRQTLTASSFVCHARHRRIQIRGVVREPDRPRRHEQRHRRHHGPEKEKAHQTAGAVGTVRFEEILIAAAGPRHGGAEFGPHQPIGNRDHRPDQPAQHRLRSVHRLEQERNGQERSGADHRDDVGGRRGREPHPALEAGWLCYLCVAHARRPLSRG